MGLVAACGTYQAYDGAPLPPSQRAVIVEATSQFFEEVRITSLDGKRFPGWPDRAEVAPGYHSLSANFQAQYGSVGSRGIRDCVIEFEAVAGHEYQIDYQRGGGSWAAWLVDTASGDRVAVCSWTAAPVYSWTPRPTPTPTPADS
jgi:hypothetical protein